MDRKALFDAVRPCGPGAKLKPEWVPIIDALADAMGLPRAAGGPGKPDPDLIAALKKDQGLRLKAYPDPMSPRARTGHCHAPRKTTFGKTMAGPFGDGKTMAVIDRRASVVPSFP